MVCTADIVLNGIIRGHHVYKTIWSPFVAEPLHLQTHAGNKHNTHAVTIIKNSVMVGMHPGRCRRYISTFYSMVKVYLLNLLATESMAMDWKSVAVILSQGSTNTLNQPRNL